MTTRNVSAVSATIVCAMVSVAWCQANQLEDPVDQIQSFRQERYDTLRMLTEVVAQRHAEGTTDIVHLYNARHQLLQAKVDLVTTHEEKVKTHERIVANLAGKESLITSRHRAGAGAILEDTLRAKAERLQAAIRLLELKASIQ